MLVLWIISILAGAEFVEGHRRATYEEHRREQQRISGREEQYDDAQEQTSTTTSADAEKMWSQENKKVCKGQCTHGWEAPSIRSTVVYACSLQKLSGDWAGDSCRLTDSYMLRDKETTRKFYRIQLGMLKAKARKFKAGCGSSSWNGKVCLRRQQHILRALKFVDKARKFAADWLSEQQHAAGEDAVAVANEALAVGFGHPELKTLVETSKENDLVLHHPSIAMRKAASLVYDLLHGSKQAQLAAQASIRAGTALVPTAEELAEEISSSGEEVPDAVVKNLADRLDTDDRKAEAALVTGADMSAMSLAEVDAQGLEAMEKISYGDAAKIIGVTVVVVAVLSAVFWAVAEILWAIVIWTTASMLGCGVWHMFKGATQPDVPHPQPQPQASLLQAEPAQSDHTTLSLLQAEVRLGEEFPLWEFFKCWGRVFVWPFTMLWFAGRWTWRKVRGTGNSLLDTSRPRVVRAVPQQ